MTSPEMEPDEEMRALAVEEAQTTLEALDDLRRRIKFELIPHDPVEDGSAIIEVRTAIGGEESASFVAQISRMYTKYCEAVMDEESGRARFQVEEINAVPIDAVASSDAFREVILHIIGKGAYKMLRHEAGIQRVQRIPANQSTGRIQSSTIAILVLPGGNADGSNNDSEVKDDVVDPKDVKLEVMRSRGAGGQHVNKTESAVRLTHEPTGITVSMQDSRSQHQNRTKAWAVLRARLQDRKMQEEQSQNRNFRKIQIGGMDRSDRVRTYNFPQDRVTDHRVPINVSGIDEIMNGEAEGGLAYLIDALRQHQEDLTLQHLQQQVKDEIVILEKELAQ
jgi:peptide chain release factor 1